MVSERRTFGERLKRHRERRGVTLESISKTSKIPAALFAGLERGDCSRWPAGLYGRAYVRAYAEAIGLNPDETVEDFVAAFAGTLQGDATDAALAPAARPAGALRIGMVDEPTLDPVRALKRAAWAATDLAIASGLAWGTHALLDTTVLVTVGAALAYHATGRLVSDEPLPLWMIRRLRATSARPAVDEQPGEVGVGTAASTTA
jgi:hypothetical protein